MKVVVVIPTYNERENIGVILDKLRDSFRNKTAHTLSYLVVDDTSPDGTAQVVEKYRKTHRDVFLTSGRKAGLGKALLRGMVEAFEHMHADAVLQIDADLSHDPSIAPKFLDALDKGFTFAVGSRYILGGGIPENWGFIRKVYSIAGNNIVRFGLWHPNIRDWTGGYRAYLKKFYTLTHEEMEEYSGYVFQIAFLHKSVHRGANVTEIPFHFTDRLYGHSKIAPAEYIFNIFKYIAIARLNELMRGSFGKFLVVGGVGFGINAGLLIIFHEWFGWPPAGANLVGAAAAIFSNFNFNNLWTFGSRRANGVVEYLKKLAQFYLTSAFGVLAIQTGTIWIGVRIFGEARYFVSFLLGTAFLVLWNYSMYSRVIWKKK